MGLFKTKIAYNGTPFTAYISIINGSDSNTGTINSPYATLSPISVSNAILLNGLYPTTATVLHDTLLQGDNTESGFAESVTFGTNGSAPCAAIYIKFQKNVTCRSVSFNNCVINGTMLGNDAYFSYVNNYLKNNFINTYSVFNFSGANLSVSTSLLTILNYNNYIKYGLGNSMIVSDSIFVKTVDLYNYTSRLSLTAYPVFKNCLFRKSVTWKWNSSPITIDWNGPGETLMEKVYNSLLSYANALPRGNSTQIEDSNYAKAILLTQSTMFQDCVVYDDSNTTDNPIFSKYVGGVPVDFTLALKSNNPALYMSTTGSYVGCYAANVNDDGAGNALTFGAVKHVDTTTGADTATTPNLLIQDGSNPAKFSASQSSTQLWNRIRTSVVAYPRGKSFAGMQSQLDSGIVSRLFFGKRQEIRTTGDISQKTTAFESVEVIPYDIIPPNNNTTQNTINNMSTFLPRFSAPFNGECLMFYKAGVPLKFNDYNGLKTLFTGNGLVTTNGTSTITGNASTTFLADFVKDDNIRISGVDYRILSVSSNSSMTVTATVPAQTNVTYQVGVQVDKSQTIYGTWAVTNADIESYSLLQKATKAGLTTSIPLIKYAKFELNLHYDEE